MNTRFDQFERIQQYLRGVMPYEERELFEKELANDENLRKQYDEVSVIAGSIKRVHQEANLRRSFMEIERQISEGQEETVGSARVIPRFNRAVYRKWVSYAVAACLALVVCPSAYWGYNAQKVGYGFSLPDGVKGYSEIEALMESRDNKAAIKKIGEARSWIEAEKENPMYDDRAYLDNLDNQGQELDFLEAICQLRRWRFFSGKKALAKIANGGGVYAEEAKELLDKL